MHRILTPDQYDILRQERELLSELSQIAVQVEAPHTDLDLIARSRQQLDEFFLLVVLGEFNSGKSAFINALLGQRFLDEGVTPTTSQVHLLSHGPQPAAQQIEPFLLRLTYPIDWLQEINVVDTPGTNAIIRRHQEITEAFIPRADLVLFITSADRPFSESERAFLELVRDWGKKVVVIVNKIDILESDSAINQVIDFVRDHAAGLLGTIPHIFPVSVRLAQKAKESADPAERDRLLADSRFAALETFILRTLDQQQRLRLKLESPLGVAAKQQQTYQSHVRNRLQVLQDDFATIEHIDADLSAYADDMHHDFGFRFSKIENILLDVRARGDTFFEETIRIGRFFDLINTAKLQAEFEQKVLGDSQARIEQEVSDLIDWMVERNYRQWQDITQYLNRRAAQHSSRIVGEIGGDFEINRRQLLDSVGRAAREVVTAYDREGEARKLTDGVKNALAVIGAVEVGAIGLGVVLLQVLTRALDPLGILAAGGLAIVGLFILPNKRRAAKADLDRRIDDLAEKLRAAIGAQFNRELDASVHDIREAIAPYTRFIRVEHSKLGRLDDQLTQATLKVGELRRRIAALWAGSTPA